MIRRWIFGWVGLALLLLGSACRTQQAATPPAVTGDFDVMAFVGTYTGTWTNQTTGATGPAKIVIVADEATHTATLTIDFDGPYLGVIDPPAQTLVGTYDGEMARVKGSNPLLFGDYDVTIDAQGKIIGVMKNLAAGVIPEMTYTGTIGDGRLDADYTVTLGDGKVVNSILRLERTP